MAIDNHPWSDCAVNLAENTVHEGILCLITLVKEISFSAHRDKRCWTNNVAVKTRRETIGVRRINEGRGR